MPPSSTHLASLGANLAAGHGTFAGSYVTAEEYAQILPPAAVSSDQEVGKAAVRTFLRNYAFEKPYSRQRRALQAGAHQHATSTGFVYLLGSLVNHECYPNWRQRTRHGMGPNAEAAVGRNGFLLFPEIDNLTLRARRNIKAGEEITISYNKENNDFSCKCATCRDRFPSCYVM